ncbi:MAG: hypothetical protein WC480_02330 [Patescibacteria group bacterium]
MFKKIALVCFLFLALAVGSVSAAVISDFTVNDTATDFLYPTTWDNLVLDITVPNLKTDGTNDTLQAITFKNNGNARVSYEIAAVKVWADGGSAGWQGWGTDQLLGTATYDGNNSLWYLNNLAATVGTNGLRLFATIDTAVSINSRKTLQFYVPALVDNNDNGVFDLSDAGLYLASPHDGPTDGDLLSSNLQAVNTSTIDFLAPQIIINTPAAGVSLSSLPITISGETRDQGRGNITSVRLGIGTSEANLIWSTLSISSASYLAWQYGWTPLAEGIYYLKAEATDNSGNIGYSSITIVNYTKNVEPSTPPVEESMPILKDGTLIKGAAGSQIYVLSNGQKCWITSEAVFLGLGYHWDKIQTISETELNRYTAGADLIITYRHPAGTLIKYQTYPQVFLITADGQRRHILNETVFLGLGYHWDEIITIPDWESYPDGAEITS